MRSKHLLLMLLLALMAPWAAIAQTVTIGNGTSAGYYTPIATYWNYSFSEQLYTATEINQSGTILSIAFEYATSDAKDFPIKVYMKAVDNANLTSAWVSLSAADLVYEGSLSVTASGWQTIELSTPFAYDGTKNLVIAIDKDYVKWFSGNTWNYTSVTGMARYYANDSNDPGITNLTTYTGTVTTNRPNIKITFGTPATCPKPTIHPATDITDNSATVSFTESGSATSWVLQYSTTSDFSSSVEEVTNFTEVSGNQTASLSSLTSLTKYYVRVKAVCTAGTDESEWSSTIDFTTKPVAVVVGDSWSDDFEGTSCGWQLINGELTNKWCWGTATNNGGTHSLYVSKDNGTSNAYTGSSTKIFATKLLNFTEGKFNFTFDWKCKGEDTYDFLRVALVPASQTLTAGTDYSTIGYSSLPSGWIAVDGGSQLNQPNATTPTWQNKEAAVDVTAGNYYLVLAWRNDTDVYDPAAAVDNVSITRVPCGYDVEGLAVVANSITTTSAQVTWTSEQPGGWQMEIKAGNATSWTEYGGTWTEKPANLTGLTPGTTYQVRMRAQCELNNPDAVGSWCEPISFTTECAAIDLSSGYFEENFEGYTAASGFLPNCWSRINTGTYSAYNIYPCVYNGGAHSSPNCLRFYTYGNSSSNTISDQYAVLPEMTNLAGKQITFFAKRGTNGTITVGIMTDDDVSTFQEIATPDLTEFYKAFTYDITGTGNHIAIRMPKPTNSSPVYYYAYVDDIKVRQAPDCATPTGLAVKFGSQTPEGATITWDKGEGTAWTVEYKKETEENWTTVTPNVTDTTYTFTGLEANTGYQTRVSVVCTAGSGLTYPSDYTTFQTNVACPTPKNLVVSNITATSATLTWTPGYNETEWTVKYKKHADAEYTTVTPNITTTPTVTLEGLTGATAYDVQIIGCDPTHIYTVNNAFTTAYGLPFMQDFEASTTNIPLGWSKYSGLMSEVLAGTAELTTTTSGWYFSNAAPINNYNAYVNIFGSSCKYWLTTPVIMNNNNDNSLSFEMGRRLSTAGTCDDDIFAVLYSIDNGATWTILAKWDNAGSEYVYNDIPVSSTTDVYLALPATTKNKGVRFAFYGESQTGSNGDYYLCINDVAVDATPTCLKPSALMLETPSAKTAHTATLKWTNGAEGQTAWQIAYSTTADFDPATVTPVDVTTNPATIEGLTQSTTYYAYVRANCGNGDYSAWCNNKYSFATLAGNVTPAGLAVAASTITSSQATASWNAVAGNTLHESYDIYWAESTVTAVPDEPAAPNLITGITATSQVISGLAPETSYKVWVRDNCGTDGLSAWSSAVTFTTASVCQTPDGLAASNVTINSATITWNTYGLTAFNLKYSSDGGTTWTTKSNVSSPYNLTELSDNTAYQAQVQATCNTEAWSSVLNFSTPCLPITITTDVPYTEDFEEPVTTAVYNTTAVADLVMPGCWDNYTSNTSSNAALPHLLKSDAGTSGYNYSSPASQVLYFYGQGNGYAALPEFTNALNTLKIDFKFALESISYGTLTLGYITGEDNGSYNTFQVIKTYTTSTAKTMVQAETTYLNNVPATATRLVFRWFYSNQWGANIDDVEVALAPAYTKTINAYSGDGGYYLIASPIAEAIAPTSVVNMISDELGATATATTSTYDLYFFDQAENDEWRNYRAGTFNLEKGKGYLYASKNGANLTFYGAPYNGDGEVNLAYSTTNEDVNMRGWNLIGNPFATAATTDKPYYRMNSAGSALNSATETTAVAAMEGIFVKATEAGQSATFTAQTRGSEQANIAQVNIVINNEKDNALDNAIIRFDKGETLEKFSFRANSSKIYMPVEGKDYAITNAEAQGEMPVSFKAENNGSYTLSFNTENVEFGYLHLIDNMTGEDVNLLETPSYSFEAKTTDYASRFRLVFATGNNANDETFAFFSNGSFVINNEGNATLQVVDVMGRILRSETINGSANVNVNAAPGVYVLRLINGDNVRTQKVVVR